METPVSPASEESPIRPLEEKDVAAFVDSLWESSQPLLKIRYDALEEGPTRNAVGYVLSERTGQLIDQLAQQKGYEASVKWLAQGLRDKTIDQNFVDAATSVIAAKAKEGPAEFSAQDLAEMVKAAPAVFSDLKTGVGALLSRAPQAAMELTGAMASVPTDFRNTRLMAMSSLQGGSESLRLLQRGLRLVHQYAMMKASPEEFAEMFSEPEIKKRVSIDIPIQNALIALERGESLSRSDADGQFAQIVDPRDVPLIQPMGEITDFSNYIPFGVGTKVAKAGAEAAKGASAAVRMVSVAERAAQEAAERAAKEATVSMPRRVVGTAVEATGAAAEKALEKPLVRGVVAGVSAAAVGSSPGTVLAAALAGGSDLSRAAMKAVPGGVKATGKAIKKPAAGPFGALVSIAEDMGRGALGGTASMIPLSLVAESPEERGALLAGGLVYGAAGAGATSVARTTKGAVSDFGRSFFRPDSAPVPESARAPVTAYGVDAAMDAAHKRFTDTMPADLVNRVEALRDLVGDNSEVYVVSPGDYTAMGLGNSSGYAFKRPNGSNVAVIRGGSEALFHEVGHVIWASLNPAEQKTLVNAVLDGYTVDELLQMEKYYTSRGITIQSQNQLIEEVLAENFQVALNGGPLGKLGTPQSLAANVYSAIGRMAERRGFRNILPGTDVVTSETLRFQPSFIVQEALRSAMEARNFDFSGTPPVTGPAPAAATPAPAPAAATPAPAPAAATPAPAPAPAPAAGDVVELGPIPSTSLLSEEAVKERLRARAADEVADLLDKVDGGGAAPALTPEAEDMLNKLSAGGAAPSFVSKNLERIAAENGVEVTDKTTPNQIVDGLKKKKSLYTTARKRKQIGQPPSSVTQEVGQEEQEAPPEIQKQNEDLFKAEVAKPRAERGAFELPYSSAEETEASPTSREGLTQPQRAEQRALADTGGKAGASGPLRRLYNKVTVPYLYKVAKKSGKPTITGFSVDKVLRNIDMLAGWMKRNPVAAQRIRDRTGVQSFGSPEFVAQFQAFLANQANGYRGDGKPLTLLPENDPEGMPPPTPGYTPVPVPEGAARLINSLMGVRNAFDPKADASVREAFVQRLAEANGVQVVEVNEVGEKGRTATEYNPVNKLLRDEGFDTNLFHVAIEQLRVRRMFATAKPRPDLSGLRAPVQGTIQIGYMPAPLPGTPEANKFRPKGNPDTVKAADNYVRRAFGRDYVPHTEYEELPEAKLKEIADYFENEAKDEPENPEVLRSYQAMAAETIEQYKAMLDAGIQPEPFFGQGEPYPSSDAMMRDVRDNKHLFFLRTDSAFGQGDENPNSPLLQKSGIKIGDTELLVNDVFRVVHDYFGHTQQGFQFGPRGEFNAWRSHSKMYSDAAQGAVAAETLAQNAWVNFGPHLRRPDGSIPTKGQPGYIEPRDRPFGAQKAFSLPARLRQFDKPGTGLGFENFFTSVTKGTFGKSDKPFKPELTLPETLFPAVEAKNRHSGNFDDHIAKSIPTFYEAQIAVVDSLSKMPAGSKVLDIAASEGSFGKAVTELSQGGVETVSLDPNPAMAEFFRTKSEVPGATYFTDAFLNGFDAGDRQVDAFQTDERFDAIHESMGFQFIDPDRASQVDEVKRLLKPDGIFVTEEKVRNPNWAANETLKDQQHKNKYFTPTELAEKDKQVGFAQSTNEKKSVGMVSNMVSQETLENVLRERFDYVVQYWDAGNFKGYVASDSRVALDRFLNDLNLPQSKFSTEATPRDISPPKTMDEAGDQTFSAPAGEVRFMPAPALDTPEFKRWFGRSQVVNVNGAPKVMYHGTSAPDFTYFNPKADRKPKPVAFLSPDPVFASLFAGGWDNQYFTNARVYPVYVSAENIFDYRNLKHLIRLVEALRSVEPSGLDYQSVEEIKFDLQRGHWKTLELPGVLETVLSFGHDGLYVAERGAEGPYDYRRVNLAVFDASQVKSAIGNVGAWGQRPLTDAELARFGLTAEQARKAQQVYADIRFMPAPALDTPEFKKWFGASKIRNENGAPQVMYHGTRFWGSPRGDFTVFSPGYETGLIFASPAPNTANIFASSKSRNGDLEYSVGSRVYPLYVRAENPFDFREQDHIDRLGDELEKHLGPKWLDKVYPDVLNVGDAPTRGDWEATVSRGWWASLEGNETLNAIKSLGFDGVYVWENGVVNIGVFDSKQVKSATGNTGAWGQRPLTDAELAKFNLTAEEARRAQEQGDIQFMPLADEKLLPRNVQFKRSRMEGSVGGVIPLVHFSSVEYPRGRLDPKKTSGRGAATPTDLRGLPRGYFYTVGTDYESRISSRPVIYSAVVDGNAVYDLDSDPLGYRGIVNREKADQMLVDEGFVGMRGTVGSTEMVALFEPVKVDKASPEEVFKRRDLAERRRREVSAGVAFMPAPAPNTPEFKRWFGDSKVVDENGKPIRAFHGTSNEFTKFKSQRDLAAEGDPFFSYFGEVTDHPSSLGFWFSAESQNKRRYVKGNAEAVASVFAGQATGSAVYPVFLSIKNPREFLNWDDLNLAVEKAGSSSSLREKLLNEGYDGLVIRDSQTDLNVLRDDWVAFEPTQVKSATGNTGAFGQRPLTDAELSKFSLTAEEAQQAQERGDIRFMAGQTPEDNAPLAGEQISTSDFMRVAAALAGEGEDAPAAVADYDPANPPKNSALQIIYSANPELTMPEGGQTISGVGFQLQRAAQEVNGGRITSKNITLEQMKRIARLVADETLAALKRKGNAVDWYTKAIKRTLVIGRELFSVFKDPEALAASPAKFESIKDAEFGLMAALAITSQNLDVSDNSNYAVEQFEILIRTGRFDPSKRYGTKAEAISSNLELANQLLDEKGWAGLRRFCAKDFTVKQLSSAASKVLGEKVTIDGYVDDVVQGAAIFGPKIGQGFLQNLLGRFDPITIDLWARRMWGRLTGDTMPEGVKPEQLAEWLDAHREAGVELPESLRGIPTVTQKTKSGTSFLTVPAEAFAAFQSDRARTQAFEEFNDVQEAKWQAVYKQLRLPMTPEMAEGIRSGTISLEQAAREVQGILESRERAWEAYSEQISRQAEVTAQRREAAWSAYSIAVDERLKQAKTDREALWKSYVASTPRDQRASKPNWSAAQPSLERKLRKTEFMSALEAQEVAEGLVPAAPADRKRKPKKTFLRDLDASEGRTDVITAKKLSDGKPRWAKSAAVVEKLFKPIDAPTNLDRRVIRQVFLMARELLSAQGVDLTNADLQATLWYPEKDIWSFLAEGKQSNLKLSYDSEFLRIAESRGVADAARSAIAKSRLR